MQYKCLDLISNFNSIMYSKLNKETLITFDIIMKHKMNFNILISKNYYINLQHNNQILPVIKDATNAIIERKIS
jgi:hypothetical protein